MLRNVVKSRSTKVKSKVFCSGNGYDLDDLPDGGAEAQSGKLKGDRYKEKKRGKNQE